MEFERDLHRVIWHEFGHMCIDILKIKNYTSLMIDSVSFKYHSNALPPYKWGGQVSVKPSIKFEKLVLNIEFTAFAILSLISGCIFQTIYFYKIIGNKSITFQDCFDIKKGLCGQSDYITLLSITIEFRKKYGYNKDSVLFIEKELQNIYLGMIMKNEEFISKINNLITEYKEIIINKYKGEESFEYILDNEQIVNLRQSLYEIMNETNFIKQIETLKNQLVEKLK